MLTAADRGVRQREADYVARCAASIASSVRSHTLVADYVARRAASIASSLRLHTLVA